MAFCGCSIRPSFKLVQNNFLYHGSRKHNCRIFFSTSGRKAAFTDSFQRYWASLKWFSIPASLGFAYICYLQFRHIQKREREIISTGTPEETLLAEWQVNMFKRLPTRALSKIAGHISTKEIPESLRSPLFRLYIATYKCNMEEAIVEDLTKYKTFHQFFTRKLKPLSRQVDENSCLVSPVDGTVLHLGEMDLNSMAIQQVKGITYPLHLFIGPRHSFLHSVNNDLKTHLVEGQQEVSSSKDEDRTVYYCNMYLAPGDYHWFHSPASWRIHERRHIPGLLLSVSPSMMKSVRGVFHFNERVLVTGKWDYGSMLFGAVGAFNVGSINLVSGLEKDLCTNSPFAQAGYNDRLYGSQGIQLQKGEPIGYFALGSSVVLVFTAPKNFKFVVRPGQKIKLGEPLGIVHEDTLQMGG